MQKTPARRLAALLELAQAMMRRWRSACEGLDTLAEGSVRGARKPLGLTLVLVLATRLLVVVSNAGVLLVISRHMPG